MHREVIHRRPTRPILAGVLCLSVLAASLVLSPTTPQAEAAPVVLPIRFPVYGGAMPVDTFGAPRSGGRSHEGQDLFAPKGRILIAAVDGRVDRVNRSNSGLSGNSIVIEDANGWEYVYIHVNNDTPGTDDGANRDLEMFLPGLHPGATVYAGQALGYVGDSGNAETTPSHLHFEIRDPSGVAINPIDSLRQADRSAPDAGRWAPGLPVGNFEALAMAPSGVLLTGWAHDPDGGSSAVEVYVNGYLAGTIPTGVSRPDVAAAYGSSAATAGFNNGVWAPPGDHWICAFARNSGRGPATAMGCRFISIPSLPFGSIDAVSIDLPTATATIQGWAIDAQSAGVVEIHAYAGGAFAGWTRANGSRTDLLASFPAFGANHGFSFQVPVPRGTSSLCLYAIDDARSDRNRTLGCQTISVPTAPFGNLETVARVPGGVVLGGWAIDPDTPAPIEVDVWEAGGLAGWASASLSRPDVGAAFPSYGPNHGYSIYVPAGPGNHSWCAFGINVPAGINPAVGCRTMNVTSTPVGNVDGVSRVGNAIQFAGWALDPDVADAVEIHLYVDGQPVASGYTGTPRGDVAAQWPAYGANRGWAITTAVSDGSHEVCAFAINRGHGSINSLLGCSTV